jgi:uncharacterized protein with ParB-like and HNH nuclease domain
MYTPFRLIKGNINGGSRKRMSSSMIFKTIDAGYFLGSIICVSRKEEAFKQHWELVDGQQRMISLSLILAAIYSKLDEFSKEIY